MKNVQKPFYFSQKNRNIVKKKLKKNIFCAHFYLLIYKLYVY